MLPKLAFIVKLTDSCNLSWLVIALDSASYAVLEEVCDAQSRDWELVLDFFVHQIHNLIYFVHDLVAHVDIESVRPKKHAFCLQGPRNCQTTCNFMERALPIFADFEATKLMMAIL